MLAGGPGSSLLKPTTFSLFLESFLGAALENRDILVLDERAAGQSEPFLSCSGYDRFNWIAYQRGVEGNDIFPLVEEVVGGCVADAEKTGIDLSTYNSVTMAADIDLAREAFGYDRFIVYEASYGTMLTQHYVRDFRDRVSAVILDGANPLSTVSWSQDRARDTEFAIANLDALCKADEKCAAAYDIPALLQKGVDTFSKGPIAASHSDPDDPTTTTNINLHVEDYVGSIYNQLNGQISVRSLPFTRALLTASGRDSMRDGLGPEIGQQILDARKETQGTFPGLMHFAVVCSDDPQRSVDQLILPEGISDFSRLFGQEAARMSRSVRSTAARRRSWLHFSTTQPPLFRKAV